MRAAAAASPVMTSAPTVQQSGVRRRRRHVDPYDAQKNATHVARWAAGCPPAAW